MKTSTVLDFIQLFQLSLFALMAMLITGCYTTSGSHYLSQKRLVSINNQEPIIAPLLPLSIQMELQVSDFDYDGSSTSNLNLANKCDFTLKLDVQKSSAINIEIDAYSSLVTDPSIAPDWIKECHCDQDSCYQNPRSSFQNRFTDFLDSAVKFCRLNPEKEKEKLSGVKCLGKLDMLQSLPVDASLSLSAKAEVSRLIGNPVSYPSADLTINRNIFSYKSYIGQQVFPGEYICLIGGGHSNANDDIVDASSLGYSTNEPISQNCIPINFTMAGSSKIKLISDPLIDYLQVESAVLEGTAKEFYPPRYGANAVLGSVNLLGASINGNEKGYELRKTSAFQHMLLISRYKRRSIANGTHLNEGPAKKDDVDEEGVFPKVCRDCLEECHGACSECHEDCTSDEGLVQNLNLVDNHRPSYILLFEKYSDLEAIRDKFLNSWPHEDERNCFFSSIQNSRSHECFDAVIEGEFLDVLIPGNIETYVSFMVTVNGAKENVRVGTTLAAILARELPLKLDWKNQNYAGAAPQYYKSNVKLDRFIDGRIVRLDFSKTQSLSDFSIPLKAGDIITWR